MQGRASLDLLKTYDTERSKVAADLIDFDRCMHTCVSFTFSLGLMRCIAFAKLFSAKVGKDVTAEEFSNAFVKAGRFTAGLTSTYVDTCITSRSLSNQELSPKSVIGMVSPAVLQYSQAWLTCCCSAFRAHKSSERATRKQ